LKARVKTVLVSEAFSKRLSFLDQYQTFSFLNQYRTPSCKLSNFSLSIQRSSTDVQVNC